MKHPALVQIRAEVELAMRLLKKFRVNGVVVEESKNGVDIYFDDVNEARVFISKLKRNSRERLRVKSSTKYAGLRKGRVRYLFTYSVKIDERNRS